MRRFLKILLVKSDVTSPYQIRQNIVSRLFPLKDANLSSRVLAREILGNRRMRAYVKYILNTVYRFQENSIDLWKCWLSSVILRETFLV